jgi:hypothetical protein
MAPGALTFAKGAVGPDLVSRVRLGLYDQVYMCTLSGCTPRPILLLHIAPCCLKKCVPTIPSYTSVGEEGLLCCALIGESFPCCNSGRGRLSSLHRHAGECHVTAWSLVAVRWLSGGSQDELLGADGNCTGNVCIEVDKCSCVGMCMSYHFFPRSYEIV